MERRIELEGCYNLRDLGGYPTRGGQQVRWRTLFRSDALQHLTTEDVSRFVGELGIGDVVDLRSSVEVRAEGLGILAEAGPRIHHLPLFDGDVVEQREQADRITLSDRYFLMAEFAKKPIARVVTTLAESSTPTVYHCAAGKDRTGVISAILLGLLEVYDEIIVADYAATQENLDEIIDRLMATEGYQEMFEVLPPDTLHAAPDTMVSLLERLRERYGSVEGYALEIGITPATITHLRTRLLAP